jgi:hypothetical protein
MIAAQFLAAALSNWRPAASRSTGTAHPCAALRARRVQSIAQRGKGRGARPARSQRALWWRPRIVGDNRHLMRLFCPLNALHKHAWNVPTCFNLIRFVLREDRSHPAHDLPVAPVVKQTDSSCHPNPTKVVDTSGLAATLIAREAS